MDKCEQLLLDLIERLNQRLTVDQAHAAAELLKNLTGSIQAAIDERPHDRLYADTMDDLGEKADRKARIAIDRAETGQARRELLAITHELLALLSKITGSGLELADVEQLRERLGEVTRKLAYVATTSNLPEHDALKCLAGYADNKSRYALDPAREGKNPSRAPEHPDYMPTPTYVGPSSIRIDYGALHTFGVNGPDHGFDGFDR